MCVCVGEGKWCGAAALGREPKRPDCRGEWCRVPSPFLLLQKHSGEMAKKMLLHINLSLYFFHIVTLTTSLYKNGTFIYLVPLFK